MKILLYKIIFINFYNKWEKFILKFFKYLFKDFEILDIFVFILLNFNILSIFFQYIIYFSFF